MQIKAHCTEFKFADPEKKMIFSGYASLFNIIDRQGDQVMAGAFTDTLKSNHVLLKRNHFDGVVGKWLTLREDEKGLYVEGELTPDHSLAKDTYALLKHGAIRGLSIGYLPVESEKMMIEGKSVRALKKIDLHEISVVDSPANTEALVSSVKSMIEEANSLKEIEHALRESGRLSRNDACLLVSRIKSLLQGELAAEEQAKHAIAVAFGLSAF